MAASPTPAEVAEDSQRLGTLAMRFRGTRTDAERREIPDDYSRTVGRLIASGCWDEVPAPEDQLPDAWMPRSFFHYWTAEAGRYRTKR